MTKHAPWDETPLALLQTLVRTPSVNPMGRADLAGKTGCEHDLSVLLRRLLAELPGVRVEEQAVAPGRANLIVRYEAPDARRTLLWDVHQDTVPTAGMTIPAFEGFTESGRLYGRGACDVKGSMAAMLWAFRRLVRERPRGSASVTLVFTVDEEYTHTGSSHLAENLPDARIDLAIVAEPTSLNLVTTHKGAVRWRIQARGTACHSARPELGDNAIYRMARVVSALERLADEIRLRPPHAVLGAPSLSVGTVAGGTAANIVPDECVVELDRRVIPGETPETAQRDLIEQLGNLLPESDRGLVAHEAPWVRMPALSESIDAATLETMQEAIAGVAMRRPEIVGVPFGTDAGPLGQAGIPCVVFGPGSIDQAHTKDEWIDTDEVLMAADCYFELAKALG